MTDQELHEEAALEQAWMNAEEWCEVFLNIGTGTIPFDNPVATDLIRKACSMVGLECLRRQRLRDSEVSP